MTAKHTPGPWQVSGGRSRLETYGHTIGPDGFSIACVFYSDQTNAEHIASLADARLIAAAPDLLEAMKEAKNGLRYWEPQTAYGASERARICALVDAAIAKAKGGAA